MQVKLSAILRERAVAALISDAEFIREFAGTAERQSEAERLLYEAMRLASLGRITQEERQAVFSILSFAVPPLDPHLAAPHASDRPTGV